ncbi:uncharacterized protein [Physeter macrocephalus]|uniref:Uncharacterized protein n=1 Tax=Physeter macrocephalus TaxID=9755 RepID=A0A455BK45_PHYMC|nr:uncharacterized protein LOC114486797 [Physeter catodon]|eukprot:XP_028349234.1 uncharacterized protein LOC114486797 [Physeter catodon]
MARGRMPCNGLFQVPTNTPVIINKIVVSSHIVGGGVVSAAKSESQEKRKGTRESVKVCLSSSTLSLNTPSGKGGSKWPRCIDRVQRQAVEGRGSRHRGIQAEGKRTWRETERVEEEARASAREPEAPWTPGPRAQPPSDPGPGVVGTRSETRPSPAPPGGRRPASQVVADFLNISLEISLSPFARGAPEPHPCGSYHVLV